MKFQTQQPAQQALNEISNTATSNQLNTRYSENEFNQLLIASLANDLNGQQLLSVTDNLNTKVHDTYIELSGVVNLDKVEQISPEAHKNLEQFDDFLFFLDKNNLNVKVNAIPVIRNGLIGIQDNFTISIGPIPFSNDALRQLGVDVAQVNHTHLKLNNLFVQSFSLENGSVILNSINTQ